ncbi:hypothetical protein OAS89_03560 [Alphaproteobacteria bacterium]|nr:hypothetical protein [Alphaproteobacteria bacterium]
MDDIFLDINMKPTLWYRQSRRGDFVTNTPAPFLTKWDRLHRLYVELSLID